MATLRNLTHFLHSSSHILRDALTMTKPVRAIVPFALLEILV
jgi:hypothetical protein